MKTWLLAGVLGVMLLAATVLSVRLWTSMDTAIGGHGWAALIIGAVLTFVVGAGLMALVFFSSRRGYDEDDREP
jgi:type VI protein secretion system component VasK